MNGLFMTEVVVPAKVYFPIPRSGTGIQGGGDKKRIPIRNEEIFKHHNRRGILRAHIIP
jgi:hypothetical protein